jgi:hypothetical protein
LRPGPLQSTGGRYRLSGGRLRNSCHPRRRVLLRCASRLRGKDFDALEVEEIHFDECFGEDVFTSREPLSWRS